MAENSSTLRAVAENDRSIGSRIRQLRAEKGLSQKEVAEPLMTASYLSLIEVGHRTPSEKMLRHIAARLGVELEEIKSGRPSGLGARLELELSEARAEAYRGKLDSAEKRLHDITKTAEAYEMGGLKARVLVVMGTLLERRGDTDGARKLFEEARELLKDQPPHLGFEAVCGLARCLNASGETRLGIHVLETYLLDLKQKGMEEPVAKIRVLSSLVHLYRAVGLSRRAREVAEEALYLSPQVEDPEQIACMSMNVARALLDEGRYDEAISSLRQAEDVYKTFDWPLPVTWTKLNRGIVEAERGQLESARTTLAEALQVLEKLPKEKADTADVLNELGRVERLLGNAEEAVRLLRRAKTLIPKGDLLGRGLNARELGLCLISEDAQAAERELRKSADYYEAADASEEVAGTLLELGRLLKKQGDVEAAARAFEEGLELASGRVAPG